MNRRLWLIVTARATAAVPLLALGAGAQAARNDAVRTALKYQETPKDGQRCSGCVQFVPGNADRGSCKVIPNDGEISPNGWCVAFTAKR